MHEEWKNERRERERERETGPGKWSGRGDLLAVLHAGGLHEKFRLREQTDTRNQKPLEIAIFDKFTTPHYDSRLEWVIFQLAPTAASCALNYRRIMTTGQKSLMLCFSGYRLMEQRLRGSHSDNQVEMPHDDPS